MPTRSLIGAPKTAVDTPALLVDLDVMESNIGRVVETCRINGIGWRPHTKGQKTPEIIQKELAAGAIGVTCAKLGEAEVLAAMGIRDILIANQIVGPAKMRRLVDLLAIADPIVGIDSTAHVDELGAALHNAGHILRVVIEVDIGMHRAGVQPGTPVVALARAIAAQPGLRFVGVMGWESHAVTIAEPSEKARVVTAAIALLTSSAEVCRAAGLPVDIVSCGGTGTLPYCAQQPGVTEIQAGGAIFSDMHYRTHYHLDIPAALTLLATVTSRPTPTRIIIDAGKKAMSSDAAVPMPLGVVAKHVGLSAEHGTSQRYGQSPSIGRHRKVCTRSSGAGYWPVPDQSRRPTQRVHDANWPTSPLANVQRPRLGGPAPVQTRPSAGTVGANQPRLP